MYLLAPLETMKLAKYKNKASKESKAFYDEFRKLAELPFIMDKPCFYCTNNLAHGRGMHNWNVTHGNS